MNGTGQINGSRPTHIQQLLGVLKDYSLLCLMLFRNSAILSSARIMSRSIKQSTRAQHPMKMVKYSASDGFLFGNRFMYILSAAVLLPYAASYMKCMSTSSESGHVRICMFEIYAENDDSSLFYLSAAFAYRHSYTKSAYLGSLYLLMNF